MECWSHAGKGVKRQELLTHTRVTPSAASDPGHHGVRPSVMHKDEVQEDRKHMPCDHPRHGQCLSVVSLGSFPLGHCSLNSYNQSPGGRVH